MSVTTPILAVFQSVGAVCAAPALTLAHGSGGAVGAALPPAPGVVLEHAATSRTIPLNSTAPRRGIRMFPPPAAPCRASPGPPESRPPPSRLPVTLQPPHR